MKSTVLKLALIASLPVLALAACEKKPEPIKPAPASTPPATPPQK